MSATLVTLVILPHEPGEQMPIAYQIQSELIVVRMYGQVSTEQFAGYLTDLENDARYSADLPRLILFADDVAFPPSQDIIAYAGKTPRRQLSAAVRFACVARSPLAVGITSMFMGHAGLGNNYQLFDDEADAWAWLGVV